MEPPEHIIELSNASNNLTNRDFMEVHFLDLPINFTSGRFEWNDKFYVFLWQQDEFGHDHAESLCQSFSLETHLASIPNKETLDVLKDVMVAMMQAWEYGFSAWLEGSTSAPENEYLEFEQYEETQIPGTFK